MFVLICLFLIPSFSSCCRLRSLKMHWPSTTQKGAAWGQQRAWRNQSSWLLLQTKISLSPTQESQCLLPTQRTWLKLSLQELHKDPRTRPWPQLGDEIKMMMIVALLLLCTVVFVIAVYSCSIPSIRGLSDLQKFYSCSTIAGLSWCFLVSWPADELLCSLKWRGRAYTLFDEGIGFSPLVNICFYVALIPELLSSLPPFSRLFSTIMS